VPYTSGELAKKKALEEQRVRKAELAHKVYEEEEEDGPRKQLQKRKNEYRMKSNVDHPSLAAAKEGREGNDQSCAICRLVCLYAKLVY
jgi:hypothetical protein